MSEYELDERPLASSAVVVTVDGELDAAEADWSDEIGRALDDKYQQVVVDLRNVTFIDSSVVRSLLLLHRRLPGDGWIHLVYTHHLIRRVVEICGLADLFPQYTTVDAALREAPTRLTPERSGVSPTASEGHTGGGQTNSGQVEPGERR